MTHELSTADMRSEPAYAEMVDDILAEVTAGNLTVGQRLAAETKLRDQYAIRASSVRRGLGLLVERSVVTRRCSSLCCRPATSVLFGNS